jgi:hypothetical protein
MPWDDGFQKDLICDRDSYAESWHSSLSVPGFVLVSSDGARCSVRMFGLLPQGPGFYVCHPEQSEGSRFIASIAKTQIPRFARDDTK